MTTEASLRKRSDRDSGDMTPVVLAPVGDSPRAAATSELACLVARQRAARIEFVYLIEVPRSLSLEAPFEEANAAAARALGTAQGVAERYAVPVGTSAYRARSASRALLLAAEAHHPDLIVIGSGTRLTDGDWAQVAEQLAQRVPCEVIVDRLPNGPARGYHPAGGESSQED